MPQGRPQRKAAAVAREKLAQTQGGNRIEQTNKPITAPSPHPTPAVPTERKQGPEADGARPKAEQMKREEGQTDKDKHTQEKKEDADSTAPLPEKVRYMVYDAGFQAGLPVLARLGAQNHPPAPPAAGPSWWRA